MQSSCDDSRDMKSCLFYAKGVLLLSHWGISERIYISNRQLQSANGLTLRPAFMVHLMIDRIK